MRRDLPREPKLLVKCYRCDAWFIITRLASQGMTGNKPMPFGQTLNRYTDPDNIK